MKRLLLLATLSLALSACPGTGSPNATSPSPAASAQAITPYTLPLNLGNGQAVSLDLQVQGSAISGELVVAERVLRTQQISRSFALGRYGFTGTFSLPRGFNISGNFPEPVGSFSVGGILPTLTDPGSFTFTHGGESVSDTLPALNTLPSPSPTPVSSPTPLSSVTPVVSPSPSTRTWTEPELRQMVVCFGEQSSLQLTGSHGAYANGLSRLNAYVAAQEFVSAETHQARLDLLGADLVKANSTIGFDCLKP